MILRKVCKKDFGIQQSMIRYHSMIMMKVKVVLRVTRMHLMMMNIYGTFLRSLRQ
jgi:hypothetical protein